MTFIGRDGRLKKNARRHHHAKIRHRRAATHPRRLVVLTGRCSEERCSAVSKARYSVAPPVRYNGAR